MAPVEDYPQLSRNLQRAQDALQKASGIAHDINNLLSPAALYAQTLLRHDTSLSADAREYLKLIHRAIEDAASTIEQIRDLQRECLAAAADSDTSTTSTVAIREATVATAPRALHLLFIDDDPVILKSLEEALAHDGHSIETARGGEHGIELIRAAIERGMPFSAVITDLGMPKLDGCQVAAAVKAVSPKLPVVLLTGWGDTLPGTNEPPACVDRVLGKPPKLAELRQVLAELTGGARSLTGTSQATAAHQRPGSRPIQ